VDSARLDNEDNALLVAPFLLLEIEMVVLESDGNKSPGPDGFNFVFLKAFWNLLKGSVRMKLWIGQIKLKRIVYFQAGIRNGL